MIIHSLLLLGLALVVPSAADNSSCPDEQICEGPVITTTNKTEIILQKGENFTLTCKGNTEIKFIQQEPSLDYVITDFKIIERYISNPDEEYTHQIDLDLINVDQYAIGYYICADDQIDPDIVNNLIAEPENDEHASYIYVYVNGTDSLFAPMREIIMPKGNKVVIECRPTTPDVKVNLTTSQNKTPVNVQYSSKIGFVMKTCRSAYLCKGQLDGYPEWKHIRIVAAPPDPEVFRASVKFVAHETFSLNCTIDFKSNMLVNLSWILPNALINYTIDTNAFELITSGKLYSNITVHNASKECAGYYTCVSRNACGNKESLPMKKEYTEPYLELTNSEKRVVIRQKNYSIRTYINAYPKARYFFYKNGKPLVNDGKKHEIKWDAMTGRVTLTIKDVNPSDVGNYTLVAQNDYNMTRQTTTEVFVADKAAIVNFDSSDKICMIHTSISLSCDVSGYPIPDVIWEFATASETVTKNSTSFITRSFSNASAILNIPCSNSGNITCIAKNKFSISASNRTRRLLVYEMANGFGINASAVDKTLWFLEAEPLALECLASKYTFSNVTWEKQDDDRKLNKLVEYFNNGNFSYYSTLKIKSLSIDDSGNFTCYGVKSDGTVVYDHIQIYVEELMPPAFTDPEDSNNEVYRYKDTQLTCVVEGAPLPKIVWRKDDKILQNESNFLYILESFNRTTINSTIFIDKMLLEHEGTYECVAESSLGTEKKMFTLSMQVDVMQSNINTYLIALAVIVLLLLMLLVIYLSLKVKKEKKFRKELAAAGLLYFKEGVTKSINPALGIDEQAELLPYDDKFEFPFEKLELGMQLGAGAFGVVYKAEARGIVNAEETTPVAVKMVKKTADNMYIKALATELKIMVHLGKHVNIVNLLGACTKNVGKRELVVIVEYCKFGNIHNYMQKHREVFIDQLTDNKEKNLGKVNRGFSSSTGGSGAHSDYFGAINTQETDHTFVNTANTANSGRKTSEGYVQPEWRSNYQSDYSFDGRSPRPLTSRDLLAWAFQIARGMEYLASRKVLHGDLAARNILLAEDNVVKICDFGLARSIYKNNEYKKTENSPLPIKWLAIECMTCGIFSTQSDIWSFGIVLWELFSLAKTPYPNLHPSDIVAFLSAGHRLDRPQYADDRLYDLMKQCWNEKPTTRPSFLQLQELLGTYLEDNVRNYYIDLNNSYMANNKNADGQEDYLAMMCAPDYNNLVTPSPHHYVNDSSKFFPPSPAKVDEEGYLKITPFSPRPGTEFDFDPRKFNVKNSEVNSCGSELTPMLTLNNLPARSGSESDHEGQNPYLNMCPRIDEETDEVFTPNSTETTQNAKNLQHCAVTNPIYITFDNDIEKNEKPKDITNNYVNINAPKGLVK